MKDEKQNHGGPLVAAVVGPSPLMRRRIADALARAGFKVLEMTSAAKLARSQRQRPFAVCFLDVRGVGGMKTVDDCRKKRPGERYVLVREALGPSGEPPDGFREFGSVAESFTGDEIADWAARAAAEERFAEAEPPLEELLQERFTSFLHHLGPAPMQNLHELVWERVERPLLKAVMEWADGNQTKAAALLGIHRNTLRAKLRTLGLSE